MAHVQATHLFTRSERRRAGHPDRWRRVGQSLGRVVYAHICLLLETEAQASPTRASVWRAEQCLKEWDRLSKAGLAGDVSDQSQVTQGRYACVSGTFLARVGQQGGRWRSCNIWDIFFCLQACVGRGLPDQGQVRRFAGLWFTGYALQVRQ